MSEKGFGTGEGEAKAEKKEQKDKVASEVAEAEFDRFAEAMDLDVEPKGMDEEDLSTFRTCKRQMLREMLRGNLVINEKGEAAYTPKVGNTEQLTFHEPDGAALMSMDRTKKGHDQKKLNSLMAEMTQTNEARFSSMKQRDLRICSSITILFLA